ncbi:MAG: AAA family ATPase [Symploca sp. SIO2G7]|nr:AAA family ATPase [Symploca sp. SIO2G7]
MKIEKLTVKNFRCFESFELQLDDRCTVLIGNNGSGKTALLDALAIAAGSWFIDFHSMDTRSRSIVSDEVRYIRQEKQGVPFLEPQTPVGVEATGMVNGQSCQWSRYLNRMGGRTTYGGAASIRAIATETQHQISQGYDVPLPLIAYYGTGRLWVQKHNRSARQNTHKIGSRLQGYIDSLEPKSNQKLFEAWMEWREQARIETIAATLEEGKALNSGNGNYLVQTPHLTGVKNAVIACIPECLDFYYSINHDQLRIRMTDGRIIPFHMLSDGYRNFVGMVADIAWRSVQLNPHLGADAPYRTQGIVLVDEIDLHLHPSWQRQVLDSLLNTFENLQFVVTTHSPQVIASAQQQWMRLLLTGEPQALNTEPVQGRDTNSILREIMGTSIRPEQMQKKLDELLSLIETGATVQAREKLEALRIKLGNNDQTLMGLEWELHDMEVHSNVV